MSQSGHIDAGGLFASRRRLNLLVVGVIAAMAMLVALMGVGATAAVAAEPPLEPVITVKPSDPNTSPSADFEYEKAAGDLATVAAYQCRQFLTASPPNAFSGWTNCSTVDSGGSKNFPALANGSQTFELRAVGTTEPGTANLTSPTASYVWVQNAPGPEEEPDITAQPTDPNTSATATFNFAVDAGETVDVTGFQCREYATATPPATPETGWAACGDATGGTVSYSNIANGSRTFEIRSRSGLISGPVGSVVWSQNVSAPSAAPTITAKPSNPNLSTAVSFSYEKAASETNEVTNFQCRQYLASNPPAGPEAGWTACGTGTSGTKAYPNLANADYKFDVRGRNGLEAGPVASSVWTQAFPLPAFGPKITSSPDKVETNTTILSFAFSKDDGETSTVDRFQCRLTADGSTPAAWAACNNGTFSFANGAKNSGYTFEVRGGNQGGYGPVTSYQFELDFADPGVRLPIGDAATTRWVGTEPSAKLGESAILEAMGLTSPGDVNGDGLNDIVAPSNSGTWLNVLFSNPDKKGTRSVGEVGPADGYRITAPQYSRVAMIGDQNGDGKSDMLVMVSTPKSINVVYGVADPSELPKCAGSEVRCLNLAAMTADQGYTIKLTGSFQYALDLFGSAGDFDGDGVGDFIIGNGSDSNMVIKGGERSGSIDILDLNANERLWLTTTDAFIVMASNVSIGDLNGDGKDEIAGMSNPLGGPGGMRVLYGRAFSADNPNPYDIDSLSNTEVFAAATPPFAFPLLNNIGDINKDGRPDLLLSSLSLAPLLGGGALGGESSVVYTPEFPFNYIVGSVDMEPDQGYWIDGVKTQSGLGLSADGISDLNGDGIPDVLLGAAMTPLRGESPGGAVYAMFTHSEPGGDPVELGGDLTPDQGVAITADKVGTGFGFAVQTMGDLDGDGLDDFAVTASTEKAMGVNEAGAVYIVYSKSFMPRSSTGNTSNVTDKSATVNGITGTHKGDSTVKFQYGTTDEFGSETAEQSVVGSRSQSVGSDLTGLNPDTEYHYRVVVTNDLGVTRYGKHRTFTTSSTPAPEGCAADSTLPGCPDYNYCEANPTKPECQTPVAKLSGVVVSVASSKVKRGKKTTATATVVNTGTAAASGLKICLKAPKKFVKGARCIKVGSLGAGSSATKKFKVTVKKNAKKGKKVTLKFTASATDVKATSGKSAVKTK